MHSIQCSVNPGQRGCRGRPSREATVCHPGMSTAEVKAKISQSGHGVADEVGQAARCVGQLRSKMAFGEQQACLNRNPILGNVLPSRSMSRNFAK